MNNLSRKDLRLKLLNDGLEAIRLKNNDRINSVIIEARNQYFLEVSEHIQSYKLFAERNYPDSLTHLENAIKIDPNFAESHILKSAVLIEMRQYENAIESCNHSIQSLMLLSNAVFYTNKGVALERMGNKDEAMFCYLKAIENDINYELAYRNALIIAINKEDFNIMLNVAEQIKENLSNNNLILNWTCSLLLIQVENTLTAGNNTISEELLAMSGKIIEIAFAKEPNNIDIEYNYACYLSRSKRNNEALDILEKIFGNPPLNENQKRLQRLAVNDADFKNLYDELKFKKLVNDA